MHDMQRKIKGYRERPEYKYAHRNRNNARYWRLQRTHKCTQCGKPLAEGEYYSCCAACRIRQSERQKERCKKKKTAEDDSPQSVNSRLKAKTICKMLNEKLTVEGLFSIVLMAKNIDGRYVFVTRSDGKDTVKTPMEMFAQPEIDNDLKAVDTAIREFYNMKGLTE